MKFTLPAPKLLEVGNKLQKNKNVITHEHIHILHHVEN